MAPLDTNTSLYNILETKRQKWKVIDRAPCDQVLIIQCKLHKNRTRINSMWCLGQAICFYLFIIRYIYYEWVAASALVWDFILFRNWGELRLVKICWLLVRFGPECLGFVVQQRQSFFRSLIWSFCIKTYDCL